MASSLSVFVVAINTCNTLHGESRKDATSPMPFLSTKEISKVGTWNVRTMYEASKTAQIAREKRAYNISVLGLCETRWTKSGQTMLNTGDTVLFSGHEEENAPHTEGVVLMLSHQAYNALIGWEALGPRMMHSSFKTRMEKIQLNIIQCYAPTNDKDEGKKRGLLQQIANSPGQDEGERRNPTHGRFQCKNRIKQQMI